MGRGRNGDELTHRIETGFAQRGHHVGEPRRVDATHVQPDGPLARGLEQSLDRAGDLVTRGELVDEAPAGGVEQRRAFAADRLRDQEALAATHADDRGRVKLQQLEIRQCSSGSVG